MKKVSVTELVEFFQCQRAWYFHRVLGKKADPYLPFIIGGAVHQFIPNWLHRETPDDRTFFYKTEESAVSGFTAFWFKEVWPEYEDFFDEETKWQALSIGKKNVKNYVRTAKNRGLPLQMERRLSLTIPELGCTLVGVIDQVRPTKQSWARQNGIESPNVVLVDLKTGRPQYEVNDGDNIVQRQIGLVNNIQATMYSFLYREVLGISPDAFAFWYLGGDEAKIVPTSRDGHDEEDMFDIIRDFRKAVGTKLTMKDFPKTPDTYKCRSCVYWEACWSQGKQPSLNEPVSPDDEKRPSGVSQTEPRQEKPEQLRMKLKGTRGRRKNKTNNLE